MCLFLMRKESYLSLIYISEFATFWNWFILYKMVMELSGVQLGLKHMRYFKIKQVRSAKKMRFSAKNGAISE